LYSSPSGPPRAVDDLGDARCRPGTITRATAALEEIRHEELGTGRCPVVAAEAGARMTSAVVGGSDSLSRRAR
jgi:hypothetical protein